MTQKQLAKFFAEGKVGVIISSDFGAGWSTWASTDVQEFLMMDHQLVAMCLANAPTEKVENYLSTKDIVIYMGGWSGTYVAFLPQNISFYIHEYDGSESIITKEQLVFNTGPLT